MIQSRSIMPTLVHPKPARFTNAAEWLAALGDVPLKRILFDPPPGTATEADLLRLVERDKRLCELLDGTLVEKAVGFWESQIAMKLVARLLAFVQARGLGVVVGPDATLRLPSSDRIRLPDVSFISTGRLPPGRDAVPTVSPDLVIEVLSPGNTQAEMRQKLQEYFASGTRLAWYVDPRSRQVAVYRSPDGPTEILQSGSVLGGEDVVPEFALPVAEIFDDLPEEA